MDVVSFFSQILPEDEDGRWYLVAKRVGGRKMNHLPYQDLPAMAQEASRLSPSHDVYFALASYGPPQKNPDTGRTHYRRREQARYVKALWWDIDCGPDKMYPTRQKAVKAVGDFVKSWRLPRPLIVSSGGGLHVYWPLAERVEPERWRVLAARLRAAREESGVRVDPARELDVCSILRVPGTLNHKHRAFVHILLEAGEVWPAGRWEERLPVAQEVLGARVKPEVNDELSGDLEGPPADAMEMARQCPAVAAMQQLGGRVPEPHWRAVIGLLKYCERGRELAHEWSREDPRYTPQVVEDRYERWHTGPTTCAYMRTVAPQYCDKCAFLGRITSPIQLGQTAPPKSRSATPGFPEPPQGFYYNEKGVLVRWGKGASGVPEAVPVTASRIHAVRRSETSDGVVVEFMAFHQMKGRLKGRKFQILASKLGEGGAALMRELGKYEIFPMTNKSVSALTEYLRREVERLKERENTKALYSRYGWHDERFLLGQRLFTSNGSTTNVQLEGVAADRARFFEPRGKTEEWVKAVNYLYNRVGMEPMQYVIGCAFGSILGAFLPEVYKGIPVALIGTQSGQGKTTVGQIACSLYGSPMAMFLNSEQGATPNARNALFAAYQNLPILVDEITNIRADALSKLLYCLANGADKLRMTGKATALTLKEPEHWNCISILTANTRLYQAMGEHRANSMAEAMRVLELDVDSYGIPQLKPSDVEECLNAAVLHAGTAGAIYVDQVVQRLGKIKHAVNHTSRLLSQKYPQLFGVGETRFWRFQLATVIVGLRLAHGMGLVRFDIQRTIRWALDAMTDTYRYVRGLMGGVTDETVAEFFSSLVGRTIVTADWRTPTLEDSRVALRGSPVARYVTNPGAHAQFGGKLIVLRRYITMWASQHRLNDREFVKALKARGLVDGTYSNVNIATGTTLTSAATSVVAFDTAALGQNAAQLKVITGQTEEDQHDADAL